MIDIDELPDLPEWVPLEKYGIGIPAGLLLSGIITLYCAFPGVAAWGSLSGYGHLGVLIIAAIGAVLLVAAGYTYAMIETEWWLLTEEKDAQTPVSFGEPDESDE